MPRVRKYVKNDYRMICQWLKDRGMDKPLPASLSSVGYVCDERVVGFIYLTDSNVCLIEGIIANPHTVPSLRRDSIKHLSQFLIDKALSMGYKNIISTTYHPTIAKLAESLGFVCNPHLKVYALREKDLQ